MSRPFEYHICSPFEPSIKSASNHILLQEPVIHACSNSADRSFGCERRVVDATPITVVQKNDAPDAGPVVWGLVIAAAIGFAVGMS